MKELGVFTSKFGPFYFCTISPEDSLGFQKFGHMSFQNLPKKFLL